jgi:hypothetical protein
MEGRATPTTRLSRAVMKSAIETIARVQPGRVRRVGDIRDSFAARGE